MVVAALIVTLAMNYLLLGGVWWSTHVATATVIFASLVATRDMGISKLDKHVFLALLATLAISISASNQYEQAINSAAWAIVLFGTFILGGRTRELSQPLRPILWFLLGAVCVAWLHRLMEWKAVFGLLHPEYATRSLPLVNANHLGALLVLGLPIALSQLRTERVVSIAYLFFAGLLLTVLNATASLIVGGLICVLYVAQRHKKIQWSLLTIGLPAAVFVTLQTSARDHITLRLNLLKDSVSLFQTHWLTGIGPGNYKQAAAPLRSDNNFLSISHIHNDFAEFIIEYGLIGSAVALAIVVVLYRSRYRPQDSSLTPAVPLSLLGVMLVALTEFPLRIPVIALLCCWLLGLWLSPEVGRIRTPSWLVPIMLGGASLTLCHRAIVEHLAENIMAGSDSATLKHIAPWRPELLIAEARRATRNGDAEQTRGLASTLLSQHGDRGEWATHSARLYANADDTTAAIKAAQHATSRDPTNRNIWLLLSRLLEQNGDTDGALSATTKAVCLSRKGEHLRAAFQKYPIGLHWVHHIEKCRPKLTLPLVKLLIEDHQLDEALIALGPLPSDNKTDLLRARVHTLRDHPEKAEAVLRDALSRDRMAPDVAAALSKNLRLSGREAEAREIIRPVALTGSDNRALAREIKALDQ